MSLEEQTFAAEVRRERESRSWTQEELAERMRRANVHHANQSTVSRIENMTRPVRLMEAQALSAIFGRTVLSMTHPDPRDFRVELIDSNEGARRRTYVDFKETLHEVTRYQVLAELDLESLNQMYPEPPSDPQTRSRIENLRENVSNFVRIDLLAEAQQIYDEARAEATAHPGRALASRRRVRRNG